MKEERTLTKAERTSLAILDSAYDLFTSQGYAATSMRQIAEGAGLALGSIYNHFSSKEKIFEAIVQDRHPIYLAIPLLRDASGSTMDEFIRNAARSMVTELGHHPEFLNLMLTELIEFKGSHAPILFERIFPDIMLIGQRLMVFQDELRPIPPSLLMRAFIGMFFSYFLTDLFLRNLMPAEMQENALDSFIDIFLNGIKQQNNQPELSPAAGTPGTSEIL